MTEDLLIGFIIGVLSTAGGLAVAHYVFRDEKVTPRQGGDTDG